jgi:D-alanyl-D-alanine carboxypeptidase (penicillin-binding protein 5/6)
MRHLLVLLLALVALPAFAQSPQPPEVAARQYILIDMASNRVLAEREADAPNDPAALTKLMTAYLVFQALHDKKLQPQQRLPVSARAWNERKGDPSLMFIDTTMTPQVDELLRGLVVRSANDAAVALAEGVAGTVENFVGMMNRQAQAWGLKNTAFVNVTGLSQAGQRSTARDLAAIAGHVVRDFPAYYPYYALRDFTFNNVKQDNRNVLLRRDPAVDGLLTGYTDAAGYCLVASAQREFPNGKRRLLSVVMGTASADARANESQKLLNWGYLAWDAIKLFDAGQSIATPPVWKGADKSARLGSPVAVFVTVPRGGGDKLQTLVERSDPLVAPLARGQRVGTLKVRTTGGAAVAEVPLVVLEPVEQAGPLGRAWDAMRLWIR